MPLIPNEDLLLSDLPPKKASWTVLRPFCATFDGYKEFHHNFPENPSPHSLSELRGFLFLEFRRWAWGTAGEKGPPSTQRLSREWWPILELMRKYLRKHPPKRAFRKLTMERTPCCGKCPVYKVSVDAKGNVRWNGKHHVRKLGSASWKIGREDLNKLRELIGKSKFGTFRKSYVHGSEQGQARCITTIEYTDGAKKRVEHYLGDFRAPSDLRDLEHEIDRHLRTWQRMGPMPKLHHGKHLHSALMKSHVEIPVVASAIPGPKAPVSALWRFALTFDGYKQLGGFAACARARTRVSRAKFEERVRMPLATIRAALFFEQRAERHAGDLAKPGKDTVALLRQLVEIIRLKARRGRK